MGRTVFMKQSGESLAGNGAPFDKDAIEEVATNIKVAHQARRELNMDGLTIVAGGGNIMRGGADASPLRDGVGRLATVANTLMLQDTLQRLHVPVSLFISPGTLLYDKASDISPYTFEPGKMLMAHERGEVALLAGGMGVNGQTTDAAVAQCAHRYISFCRGIQTVGPTEPTILKATRYDGVYVADPGLYGEETTRYRKIGAPQMLAEYDRFAAVDRTSLETLVANELSMIVFSGQRSLIDVLQEDHGTIAGKGIGTLILPQAIEAQLYED